MRYRNSAARHSRVAARRDIGEKECVALLEGIPGVVVQRGVECDLFVRRAHWPAGEWRHFEFKGPGTRIAPHQQAMLDRGETILARSAGEILERIGINTRGA